MKHKFKFFVVFVLICAFMFSCQDDESHTESSHTHEIGLISTEQFLQTLTNSELKNVLSGIINQSSTARTIGGFEEPQAAKYFEVVEQLEYTNYMLYLQEYTEENPFHLFLVVTIEKTKGEEKAAYLKYTPSDDTKLFDIKTFSGRMDVINIYGEIEAGADFENGNVANGVTTTQRCSTRISIMEVPCSHGGEHGVGEPCKPGFVNDAYYSLVINTTCFTDYDFHLPPSNFLGGGGKSGVPYYQAYLNSLTPAQLDFINKTENKPIKDKLISYINSYGSRNEVSTAILEYGMANGTAQIIPLYSFVMGSNNAQLRDKVNAVLLSMGNTIEAGRFAVDLYRLAMVNSAAANNVLTFLQQNNNSTQSIEFSKQISKAMLDTGLNFDVQKSYKSPMNIDMSAVSGNSAAEVRFRNIYNKLMSSSKFKQLFVNLFGQVDFINAKFKIENIPTPNINGQCRMISYSNGKINNDIIIDSEHLFNQSEVYIAQTIIHECIHAYLNVKLRHPSIGMSVTNLNNMDFAQCVNQYYNGFIGDQSQHDFFVNYLTPVIAEILLDLKYSLLSQNQINKVDYPANSGGVYLYAPTNTVPPTMSSNPVEWDWNDYFKYMSLIGLQNCTEFQTLYPQNSTEYYYFLRYFQTGELAFSQ